MQVVLRVKRRRLNVMSESAFRSLLLALILVSVAALGLRAQSGSPAAPPNGEAVPLAIVPLNNKTPDKAAKVTGALEVSQGKAVIAANGTVTSGTETTAVTLPRRGTLRVCASTTIRLAADSSVPAGEVPGLMMAMDHGAIEASFATGRNSDILLTPDFRILIGGPGPADVKVRLGQHGDTCVDNAGTDAPYVLVTSVFDNGSYRVQAGQRVMFQRGNIHEVVDQEKEPCGCPPAEPKGNEFPLAQSEGLAAAPAPPPAATKPSSEATQPIEPLVYESAGKAPAPAAEPAAAPAAPANPAATKPAAKKKGGFFGGIGRFFRKLFGAE
jgi:hypothetical protein